MVATAIEPVPSLNKEAVKLIERSRSNWLLSNEVYFLLRHHEEFRLVINCESPHLPTGTLVSCGKTQWARGLSTTALVG